MKVRKDLAVRLGNVCKIHVSLGRKTEVFYVQDEFCDIYIKHINAVGSTTYVYADVFIGKQNTHIFGSYLELNYISAGDYDARKFACELLTEVNKSYEVVRKGHRVKDDIMDIIYTFK